MTILGKVRLSHEQIRKIIAEHMSAKHGVSVDKVELWPTKDHYGNHPYADVDMVSGWHLRTVDDA